MYGIFTKKKKGWKPLLLGSVRFKSIRKSALRKQANSCSSRSMQRVKKYHTYALVETTVTRYSVKYFGLKNRTVLVLYTFCMKNIIHVCIAHKSDKPTSRHCRFLLFPTGVRFCETSSKIFTRTLLNAIVSRKQRKETTYLSLI